MESNNQPAFPIEEYQDDLDDSSNNSNTEIIHEDDDLLLVPVTPDTALVEPSKICVLPEVPTFMYFLSLASQYPVLQFWLFDHFSQQYNYAQVNETDYCAGNSSMHKSNSSGIEEMVQTDTNKYLMFTGFACNFTAIFPSLLLGTLTDKFGRKFVLYIGLFSTIAAQSLVLVIFHFNLSPDMLFLSSFVQGLSGVYGLFLAAVFGMAADITALGKRRGFRVATLEAVIAISVSFGTAVSGIWVKKLGYIWPMSISIGLILLALVYVFFLIPETLAERQHQPLSCMTFTKSFAFYVKDTPFKRRFKLIAVITCFLICTASSSGESNFSMLYLLHQPFCWAKEQITIFFGVANLASWMVVIAFLSVGKRWISEPVYGLIGSLSFVSMFLLRGLAMNNLMIFFSAGAGLLSSLVSPMCRTIMSRAVSPSEQGALFAGIGVLQMITAAASGIVMSSLYNVGLVSFLGLPYCVLAGAFFIAVILFIVLIIRAKRHPEFEMSSTTEEQIVN